MLRPTGDLQTTARTLFCATLQWTTLNNGLSIDNTNNVKWYINLVDFILTNTQTQHCYNGKDHGQFAWHLRGSSPSNQQSNDSQSKSKEVGWSILHNTNQGKEPSSFVMSVNVVSSGTGEYELCGETHASTPKKGLSSYQRKQSLTAASHCKRGQGKKKVKNLKFNTNR